MDRIAWGLKELDSATRLSNCHFHCNLQASLVAQVVKNLPTMLGTWVQSLDWEDSPEKGNGYPLQYSGLDNSMDYTGHKESDTTDRLSFSVLPENLQPSKKLLTF